MAGDDGHQLFEDFGCLRDCGLFTLDVDLAIASRDCDGQRGRNFSEVLVARSEERQERLRIAYRDGRFDHLCRRG